MNEKQAYDSILFTYESEVRLKGCVFNETEDIKRVIHEAAKSLTSGVKYGLLLCGDVGNGKTTLGDAIMSLVNYLIREGYLDGSPGTYDYHSVRKINATDIPYVYINDHDHFVDICRRKMLYIDDLGEEPYEFLNYGMPVHPMLDILMRRYEAGTYTIITTNLTTEQIVAKYKSERLRDRLRQMVDIIAFEGRSFRL